MLAILGRLPPGYGSSSPTVRALAVLLGLVGVALLLGAAWWLMLRKVEENGGEAGSSYGKQFVGRKERTYAATISLPGRPPEHVTVRYYSRGEAKRALRSMYGKRHVSDIHAVADPRPAGAA